MTVGSVHEDETLVNFAPVAAYPDQFVLVEFVILWFGSKRSPPAGEPAANAGTATATTAATAKARQIRRTVSPSRAIEQLNDARTVTQESVVCQSLAIGSAEGPGP